MPSPDLFAPLDPARQEELRQKEEFPFASLPFRKAAWRRFKKSRSALVSLGVLAALLLMALLGPFLTPYSPDETHLNFKNLPPNSKFWFGTDELGRDLFARCWWGARISLFVGVAAALIDSVVGVLYGALAGFLGGKWDEAMMRGADILFTIPYLLVVILLMVLLGPGIKSILAGLTLTGWVTMARIVRSRILVLKNREFTLAAVAMGASKTRVLLNHLLPNALGTVIVTAAFTIPSAIFVEAFLSFLGLGVQAPFASWGSLAYDGLAALRFYPWRLFIPALLISSAMLSFNLIGDALRDVFDARNSQW